MPSKSLAVNEYQAFAEFLQRQCGIVLGDNKQYLVRSRLSPLMVKHNFDTMKALVEQAMRPGQTQLRTDVVEAMTTHETYWFRDRYPFELMSVQILPDLATRSRKARIWSAACSAGQEPYSLAMIMQEFRQKNPGKLNYGAEILATDISKQILDQAQKGEYDHLAMARGLSEERKRQFFEPAKVGTGMVVKPDLRKMITFRQLNLLDSYSLIGKFDVIFCRNVLIYFSTEDKQKILRQFAAALNPGGYLVLGASETIANVTDVFEMKRYPNGILYIRT